MIGLWIHPKNIWRSRVSIPVPPACKAGALPFELHPHVQYCWLCVATSGSLRKPQEKNICANRESNPALKLGKLQCYRYTIGAAIPKRVRSRVSIPVPADREPTALPSELHPLITRHQQRKEMQPMGFEPMPLSRLAPKASALTTRPKLLLHQ